MELLIPGFLLLLVTILVVFYIIPQFGPLFTLIASTLLLTAGVYHHYKLFRDEYRFATWADRLKAYAPGIMYSILTLFIIGFIFSLWKTGAVPIPETPSPEKASSPSSASPTTPLSNVTNTLSNITNTASNAATDAYNASKRFVTNIANSVGNYAPNFFNPREGNAPPQGYGYNRNNKRNNNRNVSFFSEF